VSFSLERRNSMSSVFTTALLGSAVVVGSVLVGTLAKDAARIVMPCVGELCPRKSPIQNVPAQGAIPRKMKDTNQGQQMQGQDQSSGQVMPRNKVGESNWPYDRNPHQRERSKSRGKVDKGIKTTAVVRTRVDKKTSATALVTPTADKADNRINRKPVLWPYERRN
jgi:hypothetical protein